MHNVRSRQFCRLSFLILIHVVLFVFNTFSFNGMQVVVYFVTGVTFEHKFK